MSSLYEITKEYVEAFESMFDPETGEIVDENAYDELEGKLEDKFEATACYIKNVNALISSIDAEKKELEKREKVLKNSVERLKKRLADSMTASGYNKFETPKAKLSFSTSQSTEIIDEKLIPAEYCNITTTSKPDKKKIKAAITLKIDVPGARVVEKHNLQVK